MLAERFAVNVVAHSATGLKAACVWPQEKGSAFVLSDLELVLLALRMQPKLGFKSGSVQGKLALRTESYLQ